MPHVIVKMIPGRTEGQKKLLAERITQDVKAVLNCEEKWISVSIEDIPATDWPEKVYKPDILAKPDQLYKEPEYNPFE